MEGPFATIASSLNKNNFNQDLPILVDFCPYVCVNVFIGDIKVWSSQ